MNTARSALATEILSTFADRRLGPSGIAVWEDIRGEEEEIKERLCGRSWRTVSDEEIGQTPLCFLTEHALAVLLPAVLLGVLRSNSDDFRVDEMLFNPNEGPSNREQIDRVIGELNRSEGLLVLKYLRLGAGEDNKLANFTAGCAADYVARLLGDRQHLAGPTSTLLELDSLLGGLSVPEASDCFGFDVSNGPPTSMDEGDTWQIVGGKAYNEFPCEEAFRCGSTDPVIWLVGYGLEY
jgi:hypothetical protein